MCWHVQDAEVHIIVQPGVTTGGLSFSVRPKRVCVCLVEHVLFGQTHSEPVDFLPSLIHLFELES